MRISLKQLQVFAAIAKHENISLAAADISLTQSAMSMALKELESHLSTPLFQRQGKRLKLNNAGKLLQPKVIKVLQLTEEIEHFATDDAISGELRIGASRMIGSYLAPVIIAEFLTLHPKVNINLQISNTEKIVDDIQHLRLDIGLIEGICDTPNIEKRTWRQDSLAIFCSNNHPLVAKKTISYDDLAQSAWILREKGSGTRAIFTNATHHLFQPQQQLLELANNEAIKQVVKTGFGISCLSTLAIANELQRKELTTLRIDNLNLHRQLSIIKHKSQYSSRTEQAFEQLLIKHGEQA